MASNAQTQIEEMEILNPTPVEVVIGTGEDAKKFMVKPLAMGNYMKLFALVGGATQSLSMLLGGDMREGFLNALLQVRENPLSIVQYLPQLTAFLGDPLVDFLAEVLECEPEFLKKHMLPQQLAKLLFVLYTQNDVETIVKGFSPLMRAIQSRHPQVAHQQEKESSGAASTVPPSGT